MPLLTVILHHDAPATLTGPHHDWLLEDPTLPPDSLLWAARVTPPPADWRSLGSFDLTPLPPHRRLYLTYEGPLPPGPAGEDRGTIHRIDQGHAHPLEWPPAPGIPGSPARILLDLTLASFQGRIQLTRPTPHTWRATVL